MNALPAWVYLLQGIWGACFDIASNIVLKKSQGFTDRKRGIIGIAMMLTGMSLSALAMKGLPLAVVYALWMAFGVLGTALLGWRMFGQKLHLRAWLGIVMLVAGIVLLYSG